MIDKIWPEELGEELVNVDELTADEEMQIIKDSEHPLQEDRTTPEKEMNLEQSETERRENTNLRILEWMHNLEADEKEAQSIPPDNLSPAPSTGTSIIIFVRRLG